MYLFYRLIYCFLYNLTLSTDYSEEIFKTCYGSIGTRGNFESLQPRSMVNKMVIDCWALVLNYYEARRRTGLPKRLFSCTSVLVCRIYIYIGCVEYLSILTDLRMCVIRYGCRKNVLFIYIFVFCKTCVKCFM